MTVVRRVALTFFSAFLKAHCSDEKYTELAADRRYGEDRDEPIDANWEMRSCMMFNREKNDDELGAVAAVVPLDHLRSCGTYAASLFRGGFGEDCIEPIGEPLGKTAAFDKGDLACGEGYRDLPGAEAA